MYVKTETLENNAANDALIIGLSVMIAVIVIIIILIIAIVVVKKRKAKTQPTSKNVDTEEEQTGAVPGSSADLEDPDSLLNLEDVTVAGGVPSGEAIELSTFVQPTVTVETHAAARSHDLMESPNPDYLVLSQPDDRGHPTSSAASPVDDPNVFGERALAVIGDSLHRGAVADDYGYEHGIQDDNFYEPNDPAQFFDLRNLTFNEEVLRIPRPEIVGRRKVYPNYNLFL